MVAAGKDRPQCLQCPWIQHQQPPCHPGAVPSLSPPSCVSGFWCTAEFLTLSSSEPAVSQSFVAELAADFPGEEEKLGQKYGMEKSCRRAQPLQGLGHCWELGSRAMCVPPGMVGGERNPKLLSPDVSPLPSTPWEWLLRPEGIFRWELRRYPGIKHCPKWSRSARGKHN